MSGEIDVLRAKLEQTEQALGIAREREADLQNAVNAGRLREVAAARISQRINKQPHDVDGTLAAIAEAARTAIDCDGARVWLLEGQHLVASTGAVGNGAPAFVRGQFPPEPVNTPSLTAVSRAYAERHTVAVDDLRDVWEHDDEHRQRLFSSGVRSVLAAPLGVAEPVAGVIAVSRMEVRPFSSAEMATLELFASQAAVAIETARAQQALAEGLERETAVAALLQAISRSTLDLDAVLATLTRSAVELLKARTGTLWLRRGDVMEPVGYFPPAAGARARLNKPISASDLLSLGLSLQEQEPFSLFVTKANRAIPNVDALVDAFDEHSVLFAPIVASGQTIGVINIEQPGEVTYRADQLALLRTFANQAGIAIENARLLTALRERNDEVSAALEQQEALAAVLNVIASSATDAQPVLEAIVEIGERLCAAGGASAHLVHGDQLRIEVARGFSATMLNQPRATWPVDRHSVTGRSILERRTIFANRQQLLEEFSNTATLTVDYLVNSVLAAPLIQGDQAFGALAFLSDRVDAFTPQQVALIEAFADQAVIAIQNARLFGELQQRHREISEALRREEASSQILRQISRAPEQINDTLEVITAAARNLTGLSANLSMVDGESRVIRGHAKVDLVPNLEIGARFPMTEAFRRAAHTRQPVSWSRADTSDSEARWREWGLTAVAIVPIFHSEVVLGFLGLASVTVDAIPPSAIALLQSLADQAAIAIENARLIGELRERNRTISENLDVQRVMGEVLSIVASAPTNLQATLPQIAIAAQQLCGAITSTVHWIDGELRHSFNGGDIVNVETRPFDAEWTRTSLMGACAAENRVIEIACSVDELEARYPFTGAIWRRGQGSTEVSGLAMPMQGRGEAYGAISVWRADRTPFTERQHALLRALCTQAVVAIENSRLFNQLKAKTQELEVVSRHKSEFLATMSHELRTPLNAIIGYTELLQEEFTDMGQDNFLPDLGKIHSAGRHLLTLINGVLDLSKVEAGRMTMFLEDIAIPTLVREVESTVRPLVTKNRNRFTVDCPDDIGTMHADLVKLRQVLFNLLSNAAKFTENGSIELRVRRQDDGTLAFAVADTGIGLTPAQQGRLFEAFTQADADTSRKYGGTGLGLALSREFCRMMGGDIEVVSEAGVGSTFTATVPAQVVDPGNRAALAIGSLAIGSVAATSLAAGSAQAAPGNDH